MVTVTIGALLLYKRYQLQEWMWSSPEVHQYVLISSWFEAGLGLGLNIDSREMCPLGIELGSVGFWRDAWLATPRRMTPKSDLMFTSISVRIDWFRTDENESHLHVAVHMGTSISGQC